MTTDRSRDLQKMIKALEEELSALKSKVSDFYIPLTELSNETLYLVDAECRYLFVTNSMAGELGVPVNEIVGKNYRDYHKKAAADVFAETVARVIETGAVMSDEHVNRLGTKNIYRKFSPVKSPDGAVTKVAVLGFDVTRLKKAEEELWLSQQQWHSTFDAMNDVICLLGGDGRILNCNKATALLLKRECGEFAGRYCWEAVGGTIDPRPDEPFLRMRESRRREASETQIGGRWFEITVDPLIDGDGRITGAVQVMSDITDRKRTAEELKASEERYRTIIENIEDSYVEIDLTDNIIFLNSPLSNILGYAPGAILGENISNFMDENARRGLYKALDRIYKTGNPIKAFEFDLIRKDGAVENVEASISLIRDGKDNPTGFRGIIRNITERKALENERQKSYERLRKALGATVQAISSIVENRDPYTAGHQRRVADLARAIATEMGMTAEQIDGIRMAGIIHDLGKISVPAEILSKPTQLTSIEFNLIKTHPQSGFDILKDIDFAWPVARIVLEHHERMDGSGYPQGLTGDDILMESRIIAVADVVEAIASHRPYRPSRGIDVALEEISRNRGVLYDEKVVDACLKLFREDRYRLEM